MCLKMKNKNKHLRLIAENSVRQMNPNEHHMLEQCFVMNGLYFCFMLDACISAYAAHNEHRNLFMQRKLQ